MNDKFTELERYEKRARILLELKDAKKVQLPCWLSYHYNRYYSTISSLCNQNMKVLELGSGTGEHTEAILTTGAEVTAIDNSSLSLLALRSQLSHYQNLQIVVADMECLPFSDESFDVICMAGSASYAQWDKLLEQVRRLLKKHGVFIVIDVLDTNPIYKINRYLHFYKGNRSHSVIKRTPNNKWIEMYAQYFTIKIFSLGTIALFSPILALFLSEYYVLKLNMLSDRITLLQRYSFKFIMIATKK